MERTIDFSNVTSYDFSLVGPNLVLKLLQGDTVTRINIEAGSANHVKETTVKKTAKFLPAKIKRSSATKMTEEKVKEIRSTWDSVVKACGTKTAAAEKLSKIYNCSAKNIYAIIYKYSWAHV